MYKVGHVKRDPETKTIAIRTRFPDDPRLSHLAWLVATTHSGSRNAPTTEVETWEDLVVPDDE